MKLWMKRISAVLITIFTLGMYVPPTLLTTNAEQTKEEHINESAYKENVHHLVEDVHDDAVDEQDILIEPDLVEMLTSKAEDQLWTKLGPKITSKIKGECTDSILPHIEEVLTTLTLEVDKEDLIYLGITEEPANGYGEKIFNLYDYRTKKDIARFDIRRDNRPLEGYWFNFHYHVSTDNFEQHYELGEIYWDKNMPPKWMA